MLYTTGNYVQVSIRYFTTLREITDKKEEKLSFPENQRTTITVVLKVLSDKYGNPFTNYVFDTDGKIRKVLQLLINGTNITTTLNTQQETLLQNGDTIAILPPVSGG